VVYCNTETEHYGKCKATGQLYLKLSLPREKNKMTLFCCLLLWWSVSGDKTVAMCSCRSWFTIYNM